VEKRPALPSQAAGDERRSMRGEITGLARSSRFLSPADGRRRSSEPASEHPVGDDADLQLALRVSVSKSSRTELANTGNSEGRITKISSSFVPAPRVLRKPPQASSRPGTFGSTVWEA
jgi:hypothetical protein